MVRQSCWCDNDYDDDDVDQEEGYNDDEEERVDKDFEWEDNTHKIKLQSIPTLHNFSLEYLHSLFTRMSRGKIWTEMFQHMQCSLFWI